MDVNEIRMRIVEAVLANVVPTLPIAPYEDAAAKKLVDFCQKLEEYVLTANPRPKKTDKP
jgi:hypothetical protein